jgi:hypothetical protein
MAIDIYSTAYLNRLVEQFSPVPSVFLDMFFPEVLTHETEEVYFDKVKDKPRLTPFVHPLHQGKIVDSQGYETRSVKPAYVKDLRVHNPLKALKRRAGEPLLGTLSPQARQRLNLAADMADQDRMLARRMEVMAIEAIVHGRATIIGEGFNSVVTFGRDASLDVELLSAAKWDAATSPDIMQQLEDWSGQIADFDGMVDVVVMDRKAWALLRKNTQVMALLDRTRGDSSTLRLDPLKAKQVGAQYKGNLGEFEIWVYSGTYIDPADGQTKPFIPDNTVVLAGSRVEGVRHFGAIMDVDVLEARERYVTSWVERNPSRRMLSLESAPILVPYRPNSSMKIKVA